MGVPPHRGVGTNVIHHCTVPHITLRHQRSGTRAATATTSAPTRLTSTG
ncbi:hypothetical protein HMPREF1550_02228 [Actinomyces sp. oral taxon 877 str. F0543]|nr:hypothetical protein HMPREF1550_02228 [Actinomyces sp. oral taxon 877 str. F0543]